MKTKLLVFVSLITLSFCMCEVLASNTTSVKTPIYKNDNGDPPAGYDKIILLGDLMLNHGPNAVVAGANENSVYIGFNQDFGNVGIAIYNEAGLVVYSTVVNTSVQTVVIIPFTTAASGTYTVELSNAFGYADGDFEHD
jgi:hypothetical protein